MTTYLFIKQHKKTGLKYFGKTAKKDPYSYNGSGKYWLRHLKKHGKKLITLKVWQFENIKKCEKFALNFSKNQNIVKSKKWANLKMENGKDGALLGSPGLKGKNSPMYGKTKFKNPFYGKKHSLQNILFFKKIKRGANNPRAKKLTTPIGKFSTVKDASKALKKAFPSIRKLCNEQKNNYHWGW